MNKDEFCERGIQHYLVSYGQNSFHSCADIDEHGQEDSHELLEQGRLETGHGHVSDESTSQLAVYFFTVTGVKKFLRLVKGPSPERIYEVGVNTFAALPRNQEQLQRI